MEVTRLLYDTPGGFTVRELAERLGCSSRSIQRDLLDLESNGVPLTTEGRRWRIMPDARNQRLPPITFNLQEARAIFLATRLFLRFADERDPDGISMLAKLAKTLATYPVLADQMLATVNELVNRPLRRAQAVLLQSITEAWAESKTVHISYRSQAQGGIRETDLDPYFLEASATGAATYVIGFSSEHGTVRTFKIDRLESVEVTGRPFVPAEGAREFVAAQLAASWGGVVMGDDQYDVVLEFTAAVAERVRETNWHRTQRLSELEDGGVRLEMRLPSLIEFVPWVRSWGPEVVVIGPQELRARVAVSLTAAAARYAVDRENADG